MNLWVKKRPEDLLQASEQTQLRKSLRAVDLAALGIGSVVGTGIFVATGQGAHLAGPGVLLSFIIAAITAGLCALTYSELASMFPVAGSTYSYSYAAFGEVIAWIIGWDLMLEYLVSASAVASGWSTTFMGLLENLGVKLPKAISLTPLAGGIVDLPAILITLLITWILYLGIRESSVTNNIIVVIKVAVIVLFIVLGISHVNLNNLTPFAPFGWKGIMSGAAIIFFAYIGFDAVSTAAEETINPKRDVPLGLMICLGVVIILYVGVAFVLTGVVPFQEIDVGNALPAALARIGIQWGGALVATGGIIGMISTLLITVYGQVRIFMVMARDGLLPEVFSRVHPKHRTPVICTWITGALTAIIAGFFPLGVIIELCNIGTLFAFVLVSVGVIVLRHTQPQVERKFRTPLVPFTPLITIGFCLYLMTNLPILTWVRFVVWLGAGLIIYFIYGLHHSKLQKRFNAKNQP
ncbi:MAG: amino acid permease [Acidobacteriota bacterium]|nr:amino acid permease [Acidobacteriota bacterium]MDW3228450.1 amino acid permease [Acidobacteriota bacterium]